MKKVSKKRATKGKGRLKKGFMYLRGGRIVRVKKKSGAKKRRSVKKKKSRLF